MEFLEGSRGIYRPIRVLFDTPIYERALQTCWHIGSYKCQIALLTELLRLQQKNQLPSEVTAEDMTELLVEQSKSTLRVQLWEFELEDFDETEARPLLKLAWEVNTSMKMRDVEFEARRLLSSPEAAPPQFQHPKIISQAQKYARSLTEQQQEAPSSKLLSPREVVMEVVPKVLQGFWLPPPNTSFNMPSQQLSEMAVGVTKAVEDRVSTALSSMLRQVAFSRSIRDNMVLSIQERVRQGHTRDVLVKRLNCFAAEVLNTISDAAAREICVLFQPHTKVSGNMNTRKDCIQPADVVDGAEARASPAEDVSEEPGLEEDTEPIREPDSAVITPPPAPLTSSAEPLGIITVQNGLNLSLTETEEQPAPGPEPDSAVVSSPPLPLTLCDEPPVITAVQDDLTSSAAPLATTAIHNGLNNSLEKAEEQPALSTEPNSSVLSPQSAPLTLPAETPANIGLDEAEEQAVPNSEPDSAVDTTPPSTLTPADESPVVTAVQDELNTSAESPANATIHNGLNNSLEKAEEQPALSPECDSSPPAPLTPTAECPANIVLDKTEEQPAPSPEPDSAVVSTPPPPVISDDESPVITAVQDELTEQPIRVDESCNTTTEVRKTEMSGFSCFFSWLQKICCCFLPEDDTETE
ncbi:actin cytoskeleton-regulatory complex protein pan1-like [Siniperca chuatsi]|uniref:actin cytoskeleton-regulatory complex protein pan1-like n=1 Tax=Siniperca chuatsi TaxID=119488 RepID=UPI001CE1E48F|nr:actin cytoskeleton-regulatory complex protein pan1-like [Siniperca chuatsi]